MSPPFGKNLMIMRHAHSANSRGDDHERKISTVGKTEIDLMAQVLLKRGPLPELVLCSDAQRAIETAHSLLSHLQVDVDVVPQTSLYLGESDDLMHAIQSLPDAQSTVLLIGHNPAVSQFSTRLRGGGRKIDSFAPGSIACLDLPQPKWADLIWEQALCRWFLSPGEAAFVL